MKLKEWLGQKLDEPWSSHRLVNSLSDQVLLSVQSSLDTFDPSVLARIVLSYLHLNRPNQEAQFKQQFTSLVECLENSEHKWVKVVAAIVKCVIEQQSTECVFEDKLLEVAEKLEIREIWAFPIEQKYLDKEMMPFDVDAEDGREKPFVVKHPITFELDLLSGSAPVVEVNQNQQNSSPQSMKTGSDNVGQRTKPVMGNTRVPSNLPLPVKNPVSKASFGAKKIQVLSHDEMDQIMLPKKPGKLTEEEKKEKADSKKTKLLESKLKKEDERAVKKAKGMDNSTDQTQDQPEMTAIQQLSGLPMLPMQTNPQLEAQLTAMAHMQQHSQSDAGVRGAQNGQNTKIPQHGNFPGFPMGLPMPQIPGLPQQFMAQMPLGWPGGIPHMHPQFLQAQQMQQQLQFQHPLMQMGSPAQPNFAALQNLQNAANMQNFQNLQNAANMQNLQNMQNAANLQNLQNMQNAANLQNFQNATNLQNFLNNQNPASFQNPPNVQNVINDESLSRILGDANALTPENRIFIERFLRGDDLGNVNGGAPLKFVLSESHVTEPDGSQFKDIILFEMNFDKRTWRKLKKRKKVGPAEHSEETHQ